MSRTLKCHTEVDDTTRSYTCFGQFESVLGKGWGVVSRNIHGDCSAWHRKLVGGGMLRG
ncbi:hypothetical protein JCM18920_3621 [Cutibacterium acnes JCM 18920]|nr:hypothetical protein JCM18920_3621 [Cutibacterium acnes JCM 18920]